jgi:hypothetical protein
MRPVRRTFNDKRAERPQPVLQKRDRDDDKKQPEDPQQLVPDELQLGTIKLIDVSGEHPLARTVEWLGIATSVVENPLSAIAKSIGWFKRRNDMKSIMSNLRFLADHQNTVDNVLKQHHKMLYTLHNDQAALAMIVRTLLEQVESARDAHSVMHMIAGDGTLV